MTVRSCGLVPPQVRLTILTIFGASIVSAAVLRPQARLILMRDPSSLDSQALSCFNLRMEGMIDAAD